MDHISNHLPEMVQEKNLELLPPESKQLKTGEESRFLQTLQEPKIINCNLEDLKSALKNIMVKLGMRSKNWPEGEEKALLISHIIKEFGYHTIEEIKLAFDLAIGGHLYFEDPNDAKCYENFSCLYFSTIMKAYRIWASEVHKQHFFEMSNPQIEYREDVGDEAMKEWISYLRKSKPVLEFLPLMVYVWLDKNGLIKKNNAEKFEYLQQAVNYRQSQLAKSYAEDSRNLKELQAFNDMKKKGCLEGIEIDKVKDIAKRLIMLEYLNNAEVIA